MKMYDNVARHDAVAVMDTSEARDSLRVHEGCSILACPRKRQAIVRINESRKSWELWKARTRQEG